MGVQSKRRPSRKRRPRRKPAQERVIRASYDAARTTAGNRRHWADADSLSPNAAANPAVRKTVRERARHEVANNTYAKGIISTLANDVIGTGPRLQMLLADRDGVLLTEANQFVEREYSRWCEETGLSEKLRTMLKAKPVDGEALALLTTNPELATPVLLDVQPFEADRLTSPWPLPEAGEVDGIRYDAAVNPTAYHVLRNHPGDTGYPRLKVEFGKGDWLPASAVLHHYTADRPGQRRGVSEIMPALPLFAKMRRYTNAVLDAAETAARFSGVLHTNAGAYTGEPEKSADLPEVELPSNALVALPEGWDATQMKPEQPSTGYGDFKAEVINEIGRCLDMPYSIAAGNSKDYNYASGRLDHKTYFHSVAVRRDHVRLDLLDRILLAWLAEARLILGYLPRELRDPGAAVPHRYFWDEREHADPAKEATRQEKELKNRTTTKSRECARRAADWEDEERQLDREERLDIELKLRRQAFERDLREKLNLPAGGSPPTSETEEAPDGAPDDEGGKGE